MAEEANPLKSKARQLWGDILPSSLPYLQKQFPQVLWMGDPTRPQIALTFDDGPHPQDTPQILRTLDRYQVQATFFVVGRELEQHPHLVRAMAEAGHALGLHGYRHRPLDLYPAKIVRKHLLITRRLIARACRYKVIGVRDVRPPFGVLSPLLLDRLIRWRFRPVIGSIVPVHWRQSLAQTVTEVQRHAQPGALIVLHEGLGDPPVAEIVVELVPWLQAQGYRFITIDRMWQMQSKWLASGRGVPRSRD